MSAQALTWAYAQTVKPATAKFVLVTLANASNGDGYCWPGQRRLMEWTGMSERALRDQISVLEAAGLIVRERRHRKNGSRTSDGYWLVGFADLPADVAATLPAESAAYQPADIAGDGENLPAESAAHYRQNLPNLPAESAAPYEPSVEPSVLNRKRACARDEIFEALCHACFGKHHSEITGAERGQVNRAKRDLRDVPSVTPDEICQRAKHYAVMWPHLSQPPSPTALAGNWTKIGTDLAKRHSAPSDERYERVVTDNGSIVYQAR